MLPTMMIGDYLFVSKWPYGYSRYSFPFGLPVVRRPHLRQPARRAATSSSSAHPGRDEDFVKRVIGLPGDTIAVRGGHADPQRQADPATAQSATSRCRSAPTARAGSSAGATPMIRPTDGGRPACLYPAYRETLPGRPQPTRCSTRSTDPRADNFGPVTVSRGPCLPDGRQSRRQPRQPLLAAARAASASCRSKISIGRASVTFWSTDGTRRLSEALDLVQRAARGPDRRRLHG